MDSSTAVLIKITLTMHDCAICLREASSMTTLVCSHSFCEDCINCWLTISNKCPLCTQVVSDTSPAYKHEAEEIAPSVDFTGDLQFLERRLADARKRVNAKYASSQNLKSNVSKLDAEHYLAEYRDAEELFHVFTILVAENTNNGEIVHLLETINFKLLDLEHMLEGGISNYNKGEKALLCEQDYDDDFPELGHHVQKHEKKRSKPQKNKAKANIK